MSVKSSHNTLIQKITDLEKRIKKLQKFETAFQASNDAMALQDVDGKFIEVNAAFCTVMGYSREELLQMQAIDLKPSALHTVFKQEQNELKELGNIFLETVCLRKDGSPIPCEISGSVVQPANETLIHLVVRDITQRKLQEDTLRRYEKIFSLSQDLIAYVDVDYIYRMINEQFCHDHGKTREEIIGRTIAEVCGEGLFTQTVKMQLDRCLSGEIVRYQEWFECCAIGRRYRDVTYYPDRLTDGTVRGVFTVFHDLTDFFEMTREVKEAEQALLNRSEQLLSLINAAPDFIYFKDGEGRWLLANENGLQLFALEDADYIGKTDVQLAEYNEPYREAFLACQKTDEIAWRRKTFTHQQEKIMQADGKVKIYNTIKVPLFHADGRRKGLVVIGRDITEDIRASEELQRKNKEIHDTNIALQVLLDQHQGRHEQLAQQLLLNLKRIVFPYIELLGHTDLQEEGREYLQLITAHLNTLMDSFCTKLDSPSIGLTPKELLVTDMIRHGKSSADIAKLLNLTIRTVEVYRNTIRKKLKISGKKINLYSYLKEKFT